jgi:hypothetical protein
MSKALNREHYGVQSRDRRQSSVAWEKKMCGQVAWALLIHTTLLIFFVTAKMESPGTSILPYFVLVLMVALFIGIARHYDRRWRVLGPSELSDSSKIARFRFDQLKIWILSIGLPFVWAALISLMG